MMGGASCVVSGTCVALSPVEPTDWMRDLKLVSVLVEKLISFVIVTEMTENNNNACCAHVLEFKIMARTVAS
jgi:hypothetical protein